MSPPQKNILDVISYQRVSPSKNVKESESCESQRDDIRLWCKLGGHNLTEEREFSDKALSGDTWTERPGLMDAQKAAKRGMLFVVRSIDRLFRDTRKALMFLAELQAAGVTFMSITEPDLCKGTSESRMMATIFLAVAEYQREKMNARTKAKMLQHQANGRAMGGQAPYGKVILGTVGHKELRENGYEVDVLTRIISLDDSGDGCRVICRKLTEEGLKPRGKKWYPGSIRRILKRVPQIEAAAS